MSKKASFNIAEYFKKVDIFASCSEELLTDVLKSCAEVKTFEKGETVFSKENFKPCVCVILEGSAIVKKGGTVISRLEKYSVYGAAFLYNDISVFQNTVTALSPLSAAVLSKDGMDELIKNDSSVAFNYIKYLSHRVTFLNDKIEGYTAQSAEDKLLHYLKKNADTAHGQCEIQVSMKELSQVLCMSRASLYRVLDSLEQSGKIRRENKKIYILSKR